MSLPFVPKYSHPFTFDEVRELEVPIIAAEITRLEHSIARLRDSNQQIRSHVEGLSDPDDAEEAAEMNDVIAENEETIKAQEERILLLKHALEAKMGFDPTNSHYGVGENRAVITTAPVQNSPQAPQRTATVAEPEINATTAVDATDDGIYL